MTRRTQAHPLRREPGVALAGVGLVVLVVALVGALAMLRGARTALHVSLDSAPSSVAGRPLRVEVRSEREFRVDGEPLSAVEDVDFRLGGKAGTAPFAQVVVGAGVPAPVLVRVLEACTRAGFTRVNVESEAQTSGTAER